ncbi:MAG: hypothetical protein IPP40_15470, partial [bacterium]|nr:hypothetical protein [bacterium]
MIGWIADGDGRPGQGGEVTLPHAVGFSGLSITQDTLMVNRPGLYNWWVPNGDLALDFGPSWTDGPDWSVTYGTPEGDAHRLQVLTWGEHDYPQHTLGDQQLSQNDNFSCHPGADHAWRADNLSPDYRNNIANGFDTRFLLSWGQIGNFDYVGSDGICHYRLSPGQAISFSAVLFIGEYFHNPENPQPNPNDLDPSLFSYDGLIETYGRALTLFDANYAYQPPTPALNLHATHASSGEVPLNWDAPQVGSIAGYRVFGKPDSGNGERVEFTTELLTAEEYTIAGRTNGDVWLMEVQTEDLAGNHSAYASSLVRVGAIPMNSVLTGSSEQGINTLNWTGVGDPTLTHYKVVRLDSTDEVVFDNLSGLSLVDDNIVSGRVYTYTLFVQNDLGIESLPSNQISLTPFAPSQTILVYDDTRRPSQTELNNGGVSDSLVRLWYQQRLGALGEGFEYVDLTISEAPITLQTLAAYSIVIWHSENQNTGRSPSQIAQREASLREYIQIGGKLIRFGRASLQAMGLSPYSLYPPNGSEVLDPLTLDSFWVSRVQPNPDLSKNLKSIGAAPLDSNFPALTWDANKVEALR